MQIQNLQLDLRPRSNAQALDLGFALLRSHATTVYTAWLFLWLPLITACGLAAFFLPHFGFFGGGWWILIAWWLRPLIERAPLYILARGVFGEHVTWQQTLKAWPSQCGGGWFRLLVWWRPFAAGRGLYQAIWQLEGARGSNARQRMRVIGKKTFSSASWFGVACAHFEGLLQIGLFAFIGLFLSDSQIVNPFAFFLNTANNPGSPLLLFCSILAYAVAVSVIGPIYIACSFTLYLNRRASLEAWDIELMLRQLQPVLSTTEKFPSTNHGTKRQMGGARKIHTLLSIGALAAIMSLALPEQTAQAQTSAQTDSADSCSPPDWMKLQEVQRGPVQSERQKSIRQEIDQVYRDQDLRPYLCEKVWDKVNQEKKNTTDKTDYRQLALFLKYLAIATLIGFAVWLLLRYRGQIFGFSLPQRPQFATEVGGLDIRPESLPKDVAAAAMQLWREAQQRAAIALLYRATLSRLIEQNHLNIGRGATENDCLRLAKMAHHVQELSRERFNLVSNCSHMWLQAAYAHRLPENAETFFQLCHMWQQEFDGVVAQQKVASSMQRGQL